MLFCSDRLAGVTVMSNRFIYLFILQDYHSLNGALLSANSVLKRYRYTFKSDALFNELKHIVLPHMAVREREMGGGGSSVCSREMLKLKLNVG